MMAAFARGWQRALALTPIALVRWLINLIAAAALTYPAMRFMRVFDRQVDAPLPPLDLDTWTELRTAYGDAISTYVFVLAAAAAAYLILSLFLSAGTLRAVTEPHRISVPDFFREAAQYFVPVAWTTALVVALAGSLLAALGWGLHWIHQSVAEWAESPRWPFILGWFLIALFALALSWVARVLDYARLAVCSSHSRRGIAALVQGIATPWNHPFSSLLLWLAFLAVILGIGSALQVAEPWTSGQALWVTFLLGQIAILSRIYTRMAWLHAQHQFQARDRPKPEPVTAPAAEEPDAAEYI